MVTAMPLSTVQKYCPLINPSGVLPEKLPFSSFPEKLPPLDVIADSTFLIRNGISSQAIIVKVCVTDFAAPQSFTPCSEGTKKILPPLS